ncbi:MAG TPA: hypothetical protein VK983_03930 [Candidatus Limnocylindrales bacterium]|nr:hypothetical protein [Candidatus Limnocylindrales bacterium]
MDTDGSHAVGKQKSHALSRIAAWLALLLSLVALGLAYSAFNRTGANVRDAAQQTTNQVEEKAGDAANQAGQKAQDAGQAIDAGPDGVDQDDTNAPTTTTPTTPQSAPSQ